MAILRIPLYTCLLNRQPTDTVSARDLHDFLQLEQDFFDWLDTHRRTLDFVKDRDFVVVNNLIRPSLDKKASTQKTKDYFINLDMAYEMAMEASGERAKQASDYLRQCGTPQNALIHIQDSPLVRHAVGQAMELVSNTPLPEGAQVGQEELDQYHALYLAVKDVAADEDLVVLPIHEVSKTIESLSMFRDKAIELQALSVWLEQHITNLNAYIERQFMTG